MKFSFLIFLAVLFFMPRVTDAFAFQEKVSISRGLSHYAVGQMYDLLGLTERAILEYEKASQFDDASYLIHLRLGTDYARLGMLEEATRELLLVNQLNESELQSHYLLALIYSNTKEYDKAAVEYEYILKTFSSAEPQNIEIYGYLGQLYYSQRKFDRAIEQFENILEVEPSNPDIMYLLGSLYLEAGYDQKGIDIFKIAVEIDPQHDGCLNSLAYVYAEKEENLSEALDLINRALVISPNNGAYFDTLGWIYFKKGDYQKSLESLIKADSAMEDPVIYDHIGDVYFVMNNADEALKYWKLSLELLPDQDKVSQKIDNVNNEQASK
ncbi:MAG: tetratricopeptide repeat protein [Candidatus Omnitrophica bacterium]|nr:tetratricopeptide repeat protein [Candidatus Omnitrophota bacterium]MBU1995752.1 tetratricopeptide repeat protein [Candidatus Omnitrophota bacterium]